MVVLLVSAMLGRIGPLSLVDPVAAEEPAVLAWEFKNGGTIGNLKNGYICQSWRTRLKTEVLTVFIARRLVIAPGPGGGGAGERVTVRLREVKPPRSIRIQGAPQADEVTGLTDEHGRFRVTFDARVLGDARVEIEHAGAIHTAEITSFTLHPREAAGSGVAILHKKGFFDISPQGLQGPAPLRKERFRVVVQGLRMSGMAPGPRGIEPKFPETEVEMAYDLRFKVVSDPDTVRTRGLVAKLPFKFRVSAWEYHTGLSLSVYRNPKRPEDWARAVWRSTHETDLELEKRTFWERKAVVDTREFTIGAAARPWLQRTNNRPTYLNLERLVAARGNPEFDARLRLGQVALKLDDTRSYGAANILEASASGISGDARFRLNSEYLALDLKMICPF